MCRAGRDGFDCSCPRATGKFGQRVQGAAGALEACRQPLEMADIATLAVRHPAVIGTSLFQHEAALSCGSFQNQERAAPPVPPSHSEQPKAITHQAGTDTDES